MTSSTPPRLAIGPEPVRDWVRAAVEAGGARIVPVDEAEGLVWARPTGADELVSALAAGPQVRWVQTPFAGVEPLVHLMADGRIWTCGKGVYAEPVAELALTLALAGMRGLGTYARAQHWEGPEGMNLIGARVTILGGGGITESLLRLLGPFHCRTAVVRRSGAPMEGADRVVGPDGLVDLLPETDLLVLALALTPETEGIIGRPELAALPDTAWLVNVARGRHVRTDALVEALAAGSIGGAGLDVVEPEPLPDDHPLWSEPRCLLTPHVGNTPRMAVPLLSARITENVRRFGAGEPLLGLVDPDAGY
jgi:phosphoglycerate dehydrogenase-like enzyme